jgi:hypothetical protein
MASIPRSEYIGFTVNDTSRLYRLRVKQASGEEQVYTLTISNRAFLEQRVCYQDAPLICFLRLERELLACDGNSSPASHLRITDGELADYREANTKKAPWLRPRKEVKA